MALVVRTFIVDPLKTELRRDVYDSSQSPARFDIRILGNDLTGVILTIQSPVPGAAPIVLTAGVEFPAVAADEYALARALILAIDEACGGLLRVHDPIDPDFQPAGGVGTGEPGQSVFAPRPGAWGEAITIDVNAVPDAINLELNGTSSLAGYTENGIGGSGPRGTRAMDDLIATLSAPGGLAPSFVSLSYSAMASGEVQYTLVFDE
jgi:hypothetical protein